MPEQNDPQRFSPSGKPRARGIGIPFDGTPGPNNAITDVAGIEVGYVTLIEGEGPLRTGKGPIRTGVTAILPRGREGVCDPVFAGTYTLNGCGELTGTAWIEEVGQMEGPMAITNTFAIGNVLDALLRWEVENIPEVIDYICRHPVVAETRDSYLNDIYGFHVTRQHVYEAIENAHSGAIEEGSVGGGTGMITYEYKSGSGTASRRISVLGNPYTVGAFVQSNFGLRREMRIAGVPVGKLLPKANLFDRGDGSIVVVIATDAPLLPHQLKRLARRVSLGIGRSGSTCSNGSGDFFVAFSTANPGLHAVYGDIAQRAEFIPNDSLNGIFRALIEATDEAILNALVVNETMTGRDGHVVEALPHDLVQNLLVTHNQLAVV